MSKTIEEIIAYTEGLEGYSLVGSQKYLAIEISERYAQSKNETIRHLAGVNIDLKKQIQELTEWKESASKVFNNLDLQTLGKTLGIGLGKDVSINVLPKIKELQEQNSELVNVIKDLIPMAEDGYRLHKNNGSHQDFLEDDRETLKKAKELLTKYNHLKSNTN